MAFSNILISYIALKGKPPTIEMIQIMNMFIMMVMIITEVFVKG